MRSPFFVAVLGTGLFVVIIVIAVTYERYEARVVSTVRSPGIFERNALLPPETPDVSEIGTHESIFSSGREYLVGDKKIALKLSQEFFIIYPKDTQSFTAKAITLIGKKFSYSLSIVDGSCSYVYENDGDMSFSSVSSCMVRIETRTLTQGDMPTRPLSFDFTVPLSRTSSPYFWKDRQNFLYAYFSIPNRRVSLLSNYGSYYASIEKCVVGQILEPIILGPQKLTVECVAGAAVVRVNFDPNWSSDSFLYANFEPANPSYGWGGTTNLKLSPVSDSVCQNPSFGSPGGQPPTEACLAIMSDQLARCEKLGSDECFFDAAIRSQDLSLCDKIQKLVPERSVTGNNEFNRQSCYYAVAKQKLDVNICFKVDPNGKRGSDNLSPQNICIYRIAQYSRNQSLCDLMSSPEKGELASCRQNAK